MINIDAASSAKYKDGDLLDFGLEVKNQLGLSQDEKLEYKIPRLVLEANKLVDKFPFGTDYNNDATIFKKILKQNDYAPDAVSRAMDTNTGEFMNTECTYYSAQDETDEQKDFLFERGWNFDPKDLLTEQKERQENKILSLIKQDNEQNSEESSSTDR